MLGSLLSHYRIEQELGRGGMGVVYRAHDTRLDRTVAIKVLAATALTQEGDRARFYREAKACARLQHPHIASVFEIDEAVPEGSNTDDLRPFIAMEFVDGETLADVIRPGPLELDRAVRLATQIAQALEAAHEEDIVHRDIKAHNVMVTGKGDAKVLDFGLAKTAASTKLTMLNSTVGTIAYMSPEQARGEEVDRRTDIWSLGATLYEMISGRSPFAGEYEQAVVYSILNEDPEPLTALRTGVPMELEWIVGKCMAKNPGGRYQTATDLLVDLRALSLSNSGQSQVVQTRSMIAAGRRAVPPRHLWIAAVALIVAAAAGWLAGRATSPGDGATSDRPTRFTIPVPGAYEATISAEVSTIAVSPDGSAVVYREAGVLMRRELGDEQATPLAGTEGAEAVFFSPDGESIGFLLGDRLRSISGDGVSISLSSASIDWAHGFHWGADDAIFFSRSGLGIWRLDLGDDSVTQVTDPREFRDESFHMWPQLVDDGRRLLVTSLGESGAGHASKIVLLDLISGERTVLLREGSAAVYLPSGFLVYVTADGVVQAMPFDLDSGAKGSASPIASGVLIGQWGAGASFAISQTGTLVFARGDNQRYHRLHYFDRAGERGPQLMGDGTYAWGLEISPTSDLIATTMPNSRGSDIHLLDPATGRPVQFSTEAAGEGWPIWSPDGRRLAWQRDSFEIRANIVIRDLERLQGLQVAYSGSDQLWPRSWSPDGRWIAFSERTRNGGMDIFAVDVTDTSRVVTIADAPGEEWNPQISRDGRFVAYEREDLDGRRIVVTSFPETGDRWVLPAETSQHAKWSPTSDELYFWQGNSLFSAQFTLSPSFGFTRVDSLFAVPDYVVSADPYYDVKPDGTGFLIQVHNPDAAITELHVVLNALAGN